MSKKGKKSSDHHLGLGVGLTAAAVTAAGAYFLYGSKHAPENRKKVKSGVIKAKGEILEALENAKEITEEEFHDVVEDVLDTYAKARSLSKKDVADLRKEMQDNWQDLVESGVAKVMNAEKMAKKFAKQSGSTSTSAKKPAKKAAKKTGQKTTKKAASKSSGKKTTKKTAKKASAKSSKKKS